MVRRESPSKKTEKLIFHHSGSQYILAEIWGTAGRRRNRLVPPKQSKDLELRPGASERRHECRDRQQVISFTRNRNEAAMRLPSFSAFH